MVDHSLQLAIAPLTKQQRLLTELPTLAVAICGSQLEACLVTIWSRGGAGLFRILFDRSVLRVYCSDMINIALPSTARVSAAWQRRCANACC